VVLVVLVVLTRVPPVVEFVVFLYQDMVIATPDDGEVVPVEHV
jgi:hypothetical protein